ncbi:uncharacterized protein [Montipora foliosa]|uniref:uncharacterized protein isoform X2 n=1 Tax=Montipora foliosa TaxID=591990 RepID=UPI0035F1E97C
MLYSQALGIVFAVFILDIAESFCKITPGNKSLVPSSLGVILVLNCSSPSSRVNFVNASWTRNGIPIEKTSTRENEGKTWIATWLTNTSSVQEGENFECKISYPELFGGGTVKCGVSPGKPSLRKLQHAKIFNIQVLTNLREKFVCAVERGWPNPTLSWWRHGSQIHHNDLDETYYVKLSPDRKELTLTVVFISGKHHGKYTCLAENMFGNFTETTRLLVNRYKMVKWHSDLKLSPIVVLEGQNITLECTCSEHECLEKTARSYWRFQDNDVARTARVRLSHVITEKTLRILMVIRNVSRLDNGSYLCGISTSKGFDEVITRLHVVSKDLRPRILVNKREVFASVGSQALLKCSALYPSVLHYTPDPFWSRDDKRIPSQHIHYVQKQFIPKNSPKSTKVLTFQLTILNVSHEDYISAYSCGVMVNVSRERVRFFERLILEPLQGYKMVKWHSDLKLSPIVVLEGQNITLECTCSKDECLEKTARSYWRFQDNDVARTARVRLSHVITEKTLRILMVIRNVSRLDNGWYLCGINTSKGFDEVKTRLHVVSKDLRPRVLVKKIEVFASVGSQALLECSAQYPSVLHDTPDPFWSRDDKQIPSQHIHYVQKQFIPKNSPKSTKVLTFQLTILNVSHEDYVWYSCGVVVNVGRAKVRFFEKLRLRDSVDEVGEAEIKSEVEGNSLITISFIAAGSAISGFIMGVIFLVYKRCRSQKYIGDLFFETAVVDQQFRYDVFVTFSSQDSNWIKKALIPLLDNHEINYCIHYKDFEIGKPVIDNVTQSVYTSRKVLIVMSHNYMSSEFCRGELEIALYRCATMGDPCVIAIRIDGIDRSNLPKALRNRTFLDYYDLIERKTWQERLIKHLKPPPMENNLKQNSQVLQSLLQNAKK